MKVPIATAECLLRQSKQYFLYLLSRPMCVRVWKGKRAGGAVAHKGE